MTNAEAWFNKSLRPRKPEGSLGRTAQDVHLDSHTASELWVILNEWLYPFIARIFNIHRSGVLTALFGCCMAGATWNCCRLRASSVYTSQLQTNLHLNVWVNKLENDDKKEVSNKESNLVFTPRQPGRLYQGDDKTERVKKAAVWKSRWPSWAPRH